MPSDRCHVVGVGEEHSSLWGGEVMMARVRWVVGPALVAVTAAGCGMGGGGRLPVLPRVVGIWCMTSSSRRLRRGRWRATMPRCFSRVGCSETLTRNTADGTLIPWLAESWTRVSPTVWKFTLRKDVKFQDGTVMDAQAVAGALNHLLQAKVPARSFNPKSVSAVQAVDAGTVQITTPAPDVLLPLRTASPNTAILAPKAYGGAQLNIQGTCTGPFKVVKEVPGQSLQVVRNDGYWDGKPALAGAEVRFVAAGPTRVTQVRTGEADIAAVVPAVSVAALQGDSNVKLEKIPSPRTAVMLLNNSRAPFNNPAVRKAVQRAHRHQRDRQEHLPRCSDPRRRPVRADRPVGGPGQPADRAERGRSQDHVGPGRSQARFADLHPGRLQRPARVRGPGGGDPGPARQDRGQGQDPAPAATPRWNRTCWPATSTRRCSPAAT